MSVVAARCRACLRERAGREVVGSEGHADRPSTMLKGCKGGTVRCPDGASSVVGDAARSRADYSMYSGMESTFWRHWWWNGGYFGAIFAVKGLLPKAEVRRVSSCCGRIADRQTKKGELLNNLAAGTVGGFVGTTLNTPCTSCSSYLASISFHTPSLFQSCQVDPQSTSLRRGCSCTAPESGRTLP